MDIQAYLQIALLIFVGLVAGVLVFLIAVKLKNDRKKAANYVLYTSVFILFISLTIIGGFEGIGLGIISLGMFLATLIFFIYAGRKPWL